MNKETYLKLLRQHLKGIPEGDIEEAIEDLNEYFIAGLEENRTEEEISSALIDPKKLAGTIKAEYKLESISLKNSYGKMFSILGLIVSLGFVNMLFLPLILAYVLVIASFYLVVGSFYLTGVVLILSPILELIAPTLVSVPGGGFVYFMPVIGIGVLLLNRIIHKLLNLFSKASIKVILGYFKLNSSVIKKH